MKVSVRAVFYVEYKSVLIHITFYFLTLFWKCAFIKKKVFKLKIWRRNNDVRHRWFVSCLHVERSDFPLQSQMTENEYQVKVSKLLMKYMSGFFNSSHSVSPLQKPTVSDAHMVSVLSGKLTRGWVKWHIFTQSLRARAALPCAAVSTRADRKCKAASNCFKCFTACI